MKLITQNSILGEEHWICNRVSWLEKLGFMMEHHPRFIGKVLGLFGGKKVEVPSDKGKLTNLLKSETYWTSVAEFSYGILLHSVYFASSMH